MDCGASTPAVLELPGAESEAQAAQGAPPASSGTWYRWSAAELAEHLAQQPVDSPQSAAALLELLSGPRAGPPWAPDQPGEGIAPCVAAACVRLCRTAADAGDADFSLARLFEAIGRWALAALAADESGSGSSIPEPCWPQSDADPRSRAFTAAECRGVLANLLLLNVDDPVGRVTGLKPAGKAGGLRLDRAMLLDNEVGAQKFCCLLQYFVASMQSEGTADDSREVIFERRTHAGIDPQEFKARILAAPHRQHGLPRVSLHEDGMEAVVGDAFVNFANAVFGYGEFIPSCTQEEIIQVCCPEFNVGMFFIGTMRPDEAIVVHNCRRCERAAATHCMHAVAV